MKNGNSAAVFQCHGKPRLSVYRVPSGLWLCAVIRIRCFTFQMVDQEFQCRSVNKRTYLTVHAIMRSQIYTNIYIYMDTWCIMMHTYVYNMRVYMNLHWFHQPGRYPWIIESWRATSLSGPKPGGYPSDGQSTASIHRSGVTHVWIFESVSILSLGHWTRG